MLLELFLWHLLWGHNGPIISLNPCMRYRSIFAGQPTIATTRVTGQSNLNGTLVQEVRWCRIMKRVVSGGPSHKPSPPPRPSRPSGYNPVELSRFVGGALPLVIESPARLARRGSSATRSPPNSLPTRFHPPNSRPGSALHAPIFADGCPFLQLGTGNPRSASHDGHFEDPIVMAIFPPGYELSKPTHAAIPSGTSAAAGIGGNSLITIIRPAPQTGHTRVGVIDDGLSRVAFVSSASDSAWVPAPNN